MAIVRGYLTTLNQTLGPIILPEGYNGAVSVQYGSKGNDNATASSGTISLQASNNYRQPVNLDSVIVSSPLLAIDWVTLDCKDPSQSPPTDITTRTSAGFMVAEILSYVALQVIMTVAGSATGVDVILSYNVF